MTDDRTNYQSFVNNAHHDCSLYTVLALLTNMTARIEPTIVNNAHESGTPKSSSLFSFIEADNSPQFSLFKLKQGLSKVTIYFCIFQTVFSFWRFIVVSGDSGIPLPLRIVICIRATIFPLTGWAYIYSMKKYTTSDVLNETGKNVMLVGDLMLIIQALLMGAIMFLIAITHDSCESEGCDEDLADNTLPISVVYIAVSQSISMPIIYPCHHIFATLLATAISYTSMLIMAALLNVEDGLVFFAVAFMGFIVFFTFVTLEGSYYSIFRSISKFEDARRLKVASENHKHHLKIQTEEMRHMIGV
jgi:hypothetical protein